ncbi:hypothetical protein AYI70_g8715 [Smittium culicis]|uniref:Uncharacterized protein n=1 Tax=Smittium culicis TaxID=133412 RepID=A0A1R1XES2_9FUNG|nr:hypothetical protein AYI70_g8715 [Smittium culicis]
MGQPLQLRSMESNIARYTESSEGTTKNSSDYPPVENCSMVPRSTEVINSPAITTASNNGSAGSKKRKISAVEQQELVYHGMVNQQCILKGQGLFDTDVDIIVSNQRAVKQRPADTPIPKARAIGATLAANSVLPAESIVSHAFLLNFSMIDTYYRLNRSTK